MESDSFAPLMAGVLAGEIENDLRLIRQGSHAEQSEDVILHDFLLLGHRAALLYIDGLSDDEKLQRFVLAPCLNAPSVPEGRELGEYLSRSVLQVASVQRTSRLSEVLCRVCGGDAALICDTVKGALICDVKGFAKRSLSEPINETVIMGPHEGFTESLRDNVVLVRRLMRSPALISESLSVGTKIGTRLCLLYVDGVAKMENVAEMKRRILGCNVDYVSSMGMLEQLIEDQPLSLLPQTVTTERPDRAVSFLEEGQIVLLMENAPAALAMPVGLLHLYHAPDDTALRWQYGTFLRVLRLMGILLSLLLPAVYVSLTMFHPEGMPLPLLTSVIESQSRVPLSLFNSMLIMLLVFSLINEAGARVPGVMGGSLSIVSGLILGQAAVEADMFSPLLIIVVAISGLGSYAVPSFPLTMALRIAQFFLVISCGMAGYLGLVLGCFFLLMRIAGLTILNHPYFSPVAPRRPANPDAMLRLPIWRQRLRGYFASPFALRRSFGRMRAWDEAKRHE